MRGNNSDHHASEHDRRAPCREIGRRVTTRFPSASLEAYRSVTSSPSRRVRFCVCRLPGNVFCLFSVVTWACCLALVWYPYISLGCTSCICITFTFLEFLYFIGRTALFTVPHHHQLEYYFFFLFFYFSPFLFYFVSYGVSEEAAQ